MMNVGYQTTHNLPRLFSDGTYVFGTKAFLFFGKKGKIHSILNDAKHFVLFYSFLNNLHSFFDAM